MNGRACYNLRMLSVLYWCTSVGSLDGILEGGGFLTRQMTEIVGPSASGKTQVSMYQAKEEPYGSTTQDHHCPLINHVARRLSFHLHCAGRMMFLPVLHSQLCTATSRPWGQLCLSLAVRVAARQGDVLYVDANGSACPRRIRQIAAEITGKVRGEQVSFTNPADQACPHARPEDVSALVAAKGLSDKPQD